MGLSLFLLDGPARHSWPWVGAAIPLRPLSHHTIILPASHLCKKMTCILMDFWWRNGVNAHCNCKLVVATGAVDLLTFTFPMPTCSVNCALTGGLAEALR